MLRTAGGEHLGVDDPIDAEEGGDVLTLAQAPHCTVDPRAGAVLAERLGHLPLALALAAAVA